MVGWVALGVLLAALVGDLTRQDVARQPKRIRVVYYNLGAALVACGGWFGALESLWVTLWSSWVAPDGSWGGLGLVLGTSWALLEDLGVVLGGPGTLLHGLGEVLGHSWASWMSLGAVLGGPGAILGRLLGQSNFRSMF